jgi:hypothetical protein
VRVPDQILKTAVFLGKDEPSGRVYGGTGYIVSVDYGPGYTFTRETEGVKSTSRYPIMFLVTAAHVAEKLDGFDFYIRANKKRDGSLAEIKQDCSTRWWYHPTERGAVDVALMILPVKEVLGLDIVPIAVPMFIGEEMIGDRNLGIGDEVFVAGLFKNAKGSAKNIPIVRIGNVAMMPDEKIFFPTEERQDQWLYADLLELHSIGGLSGSPVFIRETIRINAGVRMHTDFALNAVNSPAPDIPGMETVELAGVGRFHFFGSIIGSWRVQGTFGDVREEARNMGIAPMVPARKILEVLRQPELLSEMNKINMQTHEQVQREEGTAVYDDSFGKPKEQTTPQGIKIPVPTTDQFFGDLEKASRKKE